MASMDPDELQQVFAAVGAFNNALQEAGAWVLAGGLNPPSTAKTVDGTTDSLVVADGPFTEAPEYLGGFWVIEAESDEAALDWTRRAAQALQSRVEVRALQDAPDA